MAIHITDDAMTLEIDNRIVAIARFSQYAAADWYGTGIASPHPVGVAAIISYQHATTGHLARRAPRWVTDCSDPP